MQIELLPKLPAAEGLYPLPELVGVFDEAKATKYPPPGSLSIDLENDWANMEGTIDDSVVVILLHAGLQSVAGHPDYDHRLIVSIPFHEALDNGLPTQEEYSATCDLGDRLTDALREGQESLLAMTMMTQGRRRTQFSTRPTRKRPWSRVEAATGSGMDARSRDQGRARYVLGHVPELLPGRHGE